MRRNHYLAAAIAEVLGAIRAYRQQAGGDESHEKADCRRQERYVHVPPAITARPPSGG